MVGGDWRVIDGAIVDLDLESLLDEHRAAARALTT
jgi:8-oxoguanine deaminase